MIHFFAGEFSSRHHWEKTVDKEIFLHNHVIAFFWMSKPFEYDPFQKCSVTPRYRSYNGFKKNDTSYHSSKPIGIMKPYP